ncbi:MAG: PleD family two-component system response regulator [Hyphomicrobium sp.]|uniref:PleD family two-component system response regulator n=1 Tax=Hyphomicrobium sp. TaxID=82 RepID=UPI003D1386D4
MTGRVLVVDDVPINRRLLQAKLEAEYFEVAQAESGPDALKQIAENLPDLILLDVMMPDMDGFEVCRRIKADPRSTHIPVVMVTALSHVVDRVKALEAGADDFLTKPVNDLALFARARSLMRLKMMMDEWRVRESATNRFELGTAGTAAAVDCGKAAVLLVASPGESSRRISEVLAKDEDQVTLVLNAAEAQVAIRMQRYDLAVVDFAIGATESLRLCSQLRAQEQTRQLPILAIVGSFESPELAKALDIGATDYIVEPIEGSEVLARARTQVRRSRYYELLRANYERGLSLALTDALTGLYNRRYMEQHLHELFARMRVSGKPLCVVLGDIDHFKVVNDVHGHAAGDEVLKAVAKRLADSLRSFDMVVRLGGEEFVCVLPDLDLAAAASVAERLRQSICSQPVPIDEDGKAINVSISLGIAEAGPQEAAMAVIERADQAMYRAKQGGRNRLEIAGNERRERLAAGA